ncbi:MAG TPA: hypothetical protein PK228_12670 [Saprospiraceae bacterium]|nr:hypothetical protein [Saprospiraceae bacterium]
MNRLDEIIKTLKTYIGEGVETALDFLEKVLDHSTSRYNDYIQIKSRYNSLQRELLLGVIDHGTYDISRNNISKALLLLAEEIEEKDLIPEGGVVAEEEDKRGEILYNVPDVMQINHEQKCAVRIAFDIANLKQDWEASPEDVLKSIRVSEIMAVSLLNVDENDPPFAIRSFSETVQFLDKDDFTEWIFYVKPIKLGRFPLILRVSVIEMINNKEYKKDIVLEEEITVQTEEVQDVEEVVFKSTGTAIALAGTLLAPEGADTPPVAQVKEAGKKGLQRVAGALLAAAALAAASYFGYRIYEQEQHWRKAKEGGRAGDYEEYLNEHPDSRHSGEAQIILDSLNASATGALPDTAGSETSVTPEKAGETPVDSSTAAPNEPVGGETVSPAIPPDKKVTTKPPPGKKPAKKPAKKQTPQQKPQEPNTPGGTLPEKETTLPETQPAPAEPLLRGNNFYFKIPRFAIVEGEQQNLYVTFYQFNQYQEVLAVLGSLGEAKMSPGMRVVFVPQKGDELSAELKYVAATPQVQNRLDGYFTMKEDELKRLANEKFKSIRLLTAGGQATKTFSFTNKGSKNLNRRAEEALKKLNEK